MNVLIVYSGICNLTAQYSSNRQWGSTMRNCQWNSSCAIGDLCTYVESNNQMHQLTGITKNQGGGTNNRAPQNACELLLPIARSVEENCVDSRNLANQLWGKTVG